MFWFLGGTIDQIARNYAAMQWWNSTNSLNMEVSPPSGLPEFDALAGKLMFDARLWRGENNNLPIEEYKIACQLDHAGFKPVDHLDGGAFINGIVNSLCPQHNVDPKSKRLLNKLLTTASVLQAICRERVVPEVCG